ITQRRVPRRQYGVIHRTISRRSVIDASPFLAFMREGGEQTFFVEMGPGWERKTARQARMDLRLSQRGDKPRAIRIERAFTGGGFNAGYNDSKEPFMVDPGDASQVELVVLLSGHGQETGNCAEWCDHRHVFTLEGASVANIQSAPGIGELRTCAREARAGVPPGQWGNWAPGRAYWCPGLPVDLMHFDMTARLDAGRPEALLYRASFAGDEPQGGNISLSAYVVWYE
ncbi:MAG: peptide-N-glycosidase F-related protein, partial [Myxococcota bacterium]